ncbi:MAG: NifU family protein [Firmicutes bacterium]|nr:NifU family protein [Bacillota bacterium]
MVDEVITSQIRPWLQADGGDIELIEVATDGTVKVRLMGRCSNCPASQFTLENLVETVLMEKVPGVTRVVTVVQTVSDDLIQDALKILRKGQVWEA